MWRMPFLRLQRSALAHRSVTLRSLRSPNLDRLRLSAQRFPLPTPCHHEAKLWINHMCPPADRTMGLPCSIVAHLFKWPYFVASVSTYVFPEFQYLELCHLVGFIVLSVHRLVPSTDTQTARLLTNLVLSHCLCWGHSDPLQLSPNPHCAPFIPSEPTLPTPPIPIMSTPLETSSTRTQSTIATTIPLAQSSQSQKSGVSKTRKEALELVPPPRHSPSSPALDSNETRSCASTFIINLKAQASRKLAAKSQPQLLNNSSSPKDSHQVDQQSFNLDSALLDATLKEELLEAYLLDVPGFIEHLFPDTCFPLV